MGTPPCATRHVCVCACMCVCVRVCEHTRMRTCVAAGCPAQVRALIQWPEAKPTRRKRAPAPGTRGPSSRWRRGALGRRRLRLPLPRSPLGSPLPAPIFSVGSGWPGKCGPSFRCPPPVSLARTVSFPSAQSRRTTPPDDLSAGQPGFSCHPHLRRPPKPGAQALCGWSWLRRRTWQSCAGFGGAGGQGEGSGLRSRSECVPMSEHQLRACAPPTSALSCPALASQGAARCGCILGDRCQLAMESS